MSFVQICVNNPAVDGVFDYRLPAKLEGMLGIGHLVTVPFRAQIMQGVVMRFVETPSVAETKEVIDLLDPLPVLTPAQIALAETMAQQTLNSLAAMVKLMLPSGLSQQADTEYRIRKTAEATTASLDNQREISDAQAPTPAYSPTQKRILGLLQKRGALRGRQLDAHFKHVDWRKSAQALVRRGILSQRAVLPPPKLRAKYIRTAQLAVEPQAALEAMPALGSTEQTQSRRAAALRFLLESKDAVAVTWVYAESGCNLSDLRILAEKDLIVLRETEIWRDPVQGVEIGRDERQERELTAAQKNALESIYKSFSAALFRPFLLHGVTGSGKTEVYLRAAEEAVRQGGQALILVPEIALTPQSVRRFLARFPGQVGLLHSKLSQGERYDTWRRARDGKLKVIIGARSALFAPLPKIKLIVLDEFHDSSYHQSRPPFYDAVQAARSYAEICGAVCIFGSATPPIAEMYRARPLPDFSPKGDEANSLLLGGETGGGAALLELPERIGRRELPPVQVVDMRAELKSGNRGIFSRELHAALAQTLARGEQAILFLNRRGTATYVFCRDCGHTLKCPRCDTPLTLHQPSDLPPSRPSNLTCHRCGYARRLPQKCPACGGTKIRAYGLGSEKVEKEVNALFPAARVLRWDWDTTRSKNAHEIILSHFVAHRADVLVGTQMLAKGLDLPLVTLVGVVLAEVGLNLPDPFAAERVFQTLTQVAGRAGRSARGGRVVLQSFEPQHAAIRFAAKHDYHGFYARELQHRRDLGYPPFAKLVRLEYRHRDPIRAESEAQKMAAQIKKRLLAEKRTQTALIGAVPCFFSKVDGVYRWQIVLRGAQPASLLRECDLRGWRVEVDPISLL
jgi:primosomal protein N' (replication factor Y)